jgi:diacylglycerol kinase (ATP)
MRNTLLIFNPTSGREQAAKKAALAEAILSKAGIKVDMYATQGQNDAERAATEACQGPYDTVIACGGDGTLHEIINGIAAGAGKGKGDSHQEIRLGIIPAGTTNDFARALKIPIETVQACKVILKGKVKKTDMGSLNSRLFINIAGGGYLTDITYEVPIKLKTYLGQLAYFVKGIEKLPRLTPVRVCLKTPELVLEEEIMLFLTANSSSVGGFRNLAPEASLSDGMLDLIVLKTVNIAEFLQLVSKALYGGHIGHPKVVYLQTPWVEITSLDEVSLNTDGEFAGHLPCRIELHPRKINIIVP